MTTSESGNGEPLTVQRALHAITKLEGLEIGLYQRTEGITWMLWGLITAGIYFTFGMFGAIYEDEMPGWAQLLWAPWVAAGIAGTLAIWRSAHLTSGSPFVWRRGRREMLTYLLLYFGSFWLAFFLLSRYGDNWDLREPGVVMLVLAVASSAAAFLTPCSRSARSMLVLVGVLASLSAMILAALPYNETWEPYAYQTMAGVTLMGGGWFLGGLWLTIKG